MHVTLGGAVAMNVHGKNGWKKGTIGDHVESVSILRDGGRVEEIARGTRAFDDVVGNWRLPDPIVEVSLKLKKVATGYLDVEAFVAPNLAATLAGLDGAKEDWEYVVGWMDCWASGKSLGRSVLHVANEHPAKEGEPRGLSVEEQVADIRIGPVPVPVLLLGLKLTAAGPQMRFVNLGKYAASLLRGRARNRQSLVAYSFLLDYLPGWNEAYRPGGFIQYQLFVPRDAAEAAFERALDLQHEMGVVSSLAVVKRHRADRFSRGYALDGFSLALDFPVTRRNASRLIALVPRVRRASPRVRRAHLQGEGLRRKRRAPRRGARSGMRRLTRALFFAIALAGVLALGGCLSETSPTSPPVLHSAHGPVHGRLHGFVRPLEDRGRHALSDRLHARRGVPGRRQRAGHGLGRDARLRDRLQRVLALRRLGERQRHADAVRRPHGALQRAGDRRRDDLLRKRDGHVHAHAALTRSAKFLVGDALGMTLHTRSSSAEGVPVESAAEAQGARRPSWSSKPACPLREGRRVGSTPTRFRQSLLCPVSRCS